MVIRLLSDKTINRIAAGEVIERPANVIKELVENAIDASATQIDIVISHGGKTLMRVSDNGCGMSADDLSLAVERHCTSKLTDDHLFDICTLGFRGEALPSIGAVAQLRIKSRTQSDDTAWQITVDGGRKSELSPTALNSGTQVDVRNLFFATPARLKFLKSDRAETTAIRDVVKRLALAHPNIRFSLTGPDCKALNYPAVSGDDAFLNRISAVMGSDFRNNSVPIHAKREQVTLTGFVGLPTFNKTNTLAQFFFINGRAVRDRQLMGALRAAFRDVQAKDRFPVAVLYIDLAASQVDVNVHPAKAEVRFRDAGLIRGLLIGTIREALESAGPLAATTGSQTALSMFRPSESTPATKLRPDWRQSAFRPFNTPIGFQETGNKNTPSHEADFTDLRSLSADTRAATSTPFEDHIHQPLGVARAQIHENYIITQTQNSLIIVDQHAAHERIVYEKLKKALAHGAISSQMLLIPEIVELPIEDVERLDEYEDEFKRLGLQLEQFGAGAICVRATPALLGAVNIKGLIQDLADDLAEFDTTTRLIDHLHRIAATMACYGSIRSGRRLKPEEMDALLREIEQTPNSGQCNHGRPTYVEMKLTDIEKLFGRR